MSKAFELFQIGLDTNSNPVMIPLFHILVAGTTGTGKTEAIRKFIEALRKLIPNLKVLIFDTKSTGRDWAGFGHDVKPYVKMSTDTRFLRDLIETSEERKIDFYLYELDEATKGTKTWYDVLENLKKRHAYFKERRHGLKEEKLGVLIIYMKALIAGYESMETSDKFNLSAPITIVPINRQEEAFQQLVIYTYHKEIKRRGLKHLLVIHDEMHKIAPSKRGTGCRRIVEEYFQEGRAAGNFGVASDQEIVGISPTVRSQCWTWILGMQTDQSKAKRTEKYLQGEAKYPQVMTLGVGWFFGVIRTPSKTKVRKFYLIPEGIDLGTARKVVRGKLKVEQVMMMLAQIRKGKEDDDLMYKERALNAERKIKDLTAELEKMRTWTPPEKFTAMRTKIFNEVNEKVQEEIKNIKSTVTEKTGEIEDLTRDRERLEKELGKADEVIERLAPLEKDAEAIRNFKEALQLLQTPGVLQDQITIIVDERLKEALGKKDLSFSIDHKEVDVNILHSKEHVEVKTETQIGRILFCAIKDLPPEGWAIKEMSQALDERGWHINMNSLNPNIGQLVKNGRLVKMGKTRASKYRLPTKLPFKITESADS